MSISVVVILEMIVIFTMIAVGFILRRSGHLGDSTVQSVSYLITYILNPCLNISIAISYEGKLPEDRFARAFIWCAILYAVLIGMSYFFPIALRIPRNEKFTYKMLTVYGNTGFIGLPICRAVFGTESLVYVTINNILFTFLIYTYGSAILRRTKRLQDGKAAEKPSFAKTLKSIFNVGTISGIIAIVIYLTDPPLPTFIGEIFSYIGEPTIFLSLMILGSSVASKPLKTLLSRDGRMYPFLLLRMIALPIVIVLIMKCFIKDPLMLGTLAVLISLPGGNMPLILSQEMGLECGELSRGIILSTIICIFTIPVVMLVL